MTNLEPMRLSLVLSWMSSRGGVSDTELDDGAEATDAALAQSG
jgi:hypothetical protein